MSVRILVCVCFVLVRSAVAQQYVPLDVLFEQSKVLNQHFYGFSLYDLDEEEFVYGVRDSSHFTPASNIKVFTLLTALKHLDDSIPGIAYKIQGDSLMFWGTGDPTFLNGRLDKGKIRSFLANAPYNLFLSYGHAKEPVYRAGWSMEDFEYDYQPELTEFPIYGNLVRFYTRSGHLKTLPTHFESMLHYLPDTSKFWVSRAFDKNDFFYNKKPIPSGFSTSKPFRMSPELFVQLLEDTLNKKVNLIQLPMPADVEYVYSASTKEVLQEMMLKSDNFIAEQMGYLSSLAKYGVFETYRLRQEMQDSVYSRFHDKINLYDHSGLSIYNKVTPRAMVELLLLIRDEVMDEDELLSYFPAGGLTGTLRSTYRLIDGKPYVWAKTGTINAVYCQSGFVCTKRGKRYAFSFLNNNHFDNLNEVKREMVRIMTFIHDNY